MKGLLLLGRADIFCERVPNDSKLSILVRITFETLCFLRFQCGQSAYYLEAARQTGAPLWQKPVMHAGVRRRAGSVV